LGGIKVSETSKSPLFFHYLYFFIFGSNFEPLPPPADSVGVFFFGANFAPLLALSTNFDPYGSNFAPLLPPIYTPHKKIFFVEKL